MTFGSVYEITNPLSTVAKQHFWDWFSGRTLNMGNDGRWALTNNGGNTTGSAMHDGVDGGYSLEGTGSGSTQQSLLAFDDVKEFSNTGSVIIWSAKLTLPMPASLDGSNDITASQGGWGMCGTMPNYWLNGIKINVPTGASSVINFGTMNNSTEAFTATDLPVILSADYKTYKLEQKSSSAVCHIDGEIKATRTSGLSTTAMQPFLYQKYPDSDVHAVYCEAWNT
tara:strand:+ start:585 stop:1259 length:675 start_codon:yes stop_codon:yes gene_type:complete